MAWNVRKLVRLAAAAVLLATLGLATVGSQTPASAQSTADENALFYATNQSRAANGLPPLQYDPALSQIANGWADQLAASGTLSHNPNYVQQVNQQVTTQWTQIGENVGYGPDVPSLENAFMNSAPHKANILGPYNRVGIGATRDGNGTLWVTVDFMAGPAIPQYDPPGTVYAADWFLRSSPSAGPPNFTVPYGTTAYQFVSGDWDGNGTQTPGVFDNGRWYLRNSNTAGSPDLSFSYGAPGYIPVVGDWDGNGTDTIGVYYNGWFYLRNSNSAGPPDIVVHYGAPGYTPVVGDWNGDGKSTVGVYVNGWWYLRNTNTAGSPDITVNYGAAGYAPVVGSWTGSAADGIGVYVNGWWYLRNAASAGSPNITVNYGAPGYAPIVGRWNSTGPTGLGVIAPG